MFQPLSALTDAFLSHRAGLRKAIILMMLLLMIIIMTMIIKQPNKLRGGGAKVGAWRRR
jgi:hypothetical protein